MKIWDHGTYESLMGQKAESQTAGEAIEDGHIEFVMHGEHLKGKFALIRMKARGKGKPQWLLIKMKDEFAKPEPKGENMRKQASKSGAKPKKARPSTAAISSRPTRSGRAPTEVELTAGRERLATENRMVPAVR